jgi:hypothetical protein
MSKNIWKTMMMSLLLMLSAQANAQNLDDILSGVLGGGQASDVVSTLTGVFSSDKQATKDNIVGTWTYTEPAIVFMSDNVLTKVASKVAANKLEKRIQEYLTKYGVKPGALTMTFNEDGTYVQVLNGKKSSGTWTVKDSKLQLTILTVKALTVTTQIDGKNMMFVTDATKLLNLFKSLGAKSNNSNIKTVTSLLKSVKGMQAGITLQKQKQGK